jgi:lysophospholipase L1-like esterase
MADLDRGAMRTRLLRTRAAKVVLALGGGGLTACSSPADPAPASRQVAEALGSVSPDVASWVGTWGAPPQDCGGGIGLNGQTLRHIVHTSIGGTAARVQISNAFGSQPLVVGDVHVANRTSNDSIDMSTDRSVTFGGQSSVTIAAGDTATSDSVAFAVAPLSDVAVSLYFPQATGNETCHQSGLQTGYIASGDVSANASLPGAQTNGDYHFLMGLDVQNSTAAGAVVTLGASITCGIASAQDANRRWPDDLAVRLNMAGYTVGVLNKGISGNQLLVDGSGQSALNRFQRDVVSQSGVKWVVFADDPINDLGDSHPTGDQLIAGAMQLMGMAHQAGIKFLCATLTPFQGAGYWSATEEMGRGQYDAFVTGANSGCDGVIDMDTATHDPANPTVYLPAYDSGDHLHPNTDGLQAMANAVDLTLFATPAPPGDDGGSQDGATDVGASSGSSSGSGSGGSSGAEAGSGSSSGGTGSGSGVGSSSSSSGAGTSSPEVDSGSAGNSFANGSPGESSGCTCTAAPSAQSGSGAGALVLCAGLALARRGRRRRASTASAAAVQASGARSERSSG